MSMDGLCGRRGIDWVICIIPDAFLVNNIANCGLYNIWSKKQPLDALLSKWENQKGGNRVAVVGYGSTYQSVNLEV